MRPFGLIRSENTEDNINNNEQVNPETEASEINAELEESKRFFSRFAPPVAHHNMVQYSHLGMHIF